MENDTQIPPASKGGIVRRSKGTKEDLEIFVSKKLFVENETIQILSILSSSLFTHFYSNSFMQKQKYRVFKYNYNLQ